MTDTPKFPPKLYGGPANEVRTHWCASSEEEPYIRNEVPYHTWVSKEEHQYELSKLNHRLTERARQVKALQYKNDKLTKYAQHLQDCAVYTEGKDDAKCSCGFSEVSK